MSSQPSRPEHDLAPHDRQRLGDAHRRLREAVAAYERYARGEPPSDRPVPVSDARALAGAQAEVEAAEADLWHLREELLGWARPTWVPPAATVADWFSEEDAVYDDVRAEPTR